MFLLNENLAFAPARRQEALDRLDWIHGLMASKPGFREAIVARYLGDPARHTVLRIWENEAAFQRFREGPDGNYGRGRPAGLYTNDTVVPRWASILETHGSGRGDYLVKSQYAVAEGGWEAFGAYQQQLGTLTLSLGGLGDRWVFRATDRSESLVVARHQDRSDFENLIENGDYARTIEGHPAGVNWLWTQCFEVAAVRGPSSG